MDASPEVEDLQAEGDWCPQCGTRYRPGFTECTDCSVALVSTPPASENHDEAVYDLTSWTDEMRAGLQLRLTAEEIAHEWRDVNFVVVADAISEHVTALIDEAELAEPLESAPGDELTS